MTAIRPSAAGGGVTRQGFAYLQGLLLRRTGTVLEAGKEYVVAARLHGLALAEGFQSVSALLEGVQTEEESGALHGKVVEAMLNGETSFFRDLYPFEAMREVLLPEIIAKREATRLLHNQIEVNRGLPARLMLKYFECVGAEWRIHPHLRQMVEFQHINLAAPWPSLPQMDFIFMRNVLLYFNLETRKTILTNVSRTLRHEGYFFLGGGETTLITDRSFESVRAGKAVCYRIRK